MLRNPHLIGLMLWFGCLPKVDLRPIEIDPTHDQVDRAREGRALLEAAAEAHGYAAWLRSDRAELQLRDVWSGPMKWFSPWPGPDVSMQITQRPGTFDSEVVFDTGRKAGWTWGLRDGQPYRIAPDGERNERPHNGLEFMLPGVQYFVDLPFRILEAPIVRAVGKRTLRDTPYDVVYATWGSVEANRDFDQFVIYIHPDTGRIEKVNFTTRQAASFMKATCHLQDQREVDGVWLAHRMSVTRKSDSDPENDWFHVMTLKDVSFTDLDGVARTP